MAKTNRKQKTLSKPLKAEKLALANALIESVSSSSPMLQFACAYLAANNAPTPTAHICDDCVGYGRTLAGEGLLCRICDGYGAVIQLDWRGREFAAGKVLFSQGGPRASTNVITIHCDDPEPVTALIELAYNICRWSKGRVRPALMNMGLIPTWSAPYEPNKGHPQLGYYTIKAPAFEPDKSTRGSE